MPEPLPPPSALRQWLLRDETIDSHRLARHKTHPWYMVIWLTGVDYFSTLGYQPGIALLAAGAISPIATLILVIVTLLCALPIYMQVAGRSYAGLGSIAMLEHILPGWWGKLMVLVLLGFAATDFVITMTLSASDAAQHATQNPFLHRYLGDANMAVTLVLLALLAAVFLKGFAEAIELAAAVCIPYLLLNAVVLGKALLVVSAHPLAFPNWLEALRAQGDWKHLTLTAAILFPRLALGLSGFETGVSVMPLISGLPGDDEGEKPLGRIQNTRKLMAAAAVIMSLLLMLSSFVSVMLVPKAAYQAGGAASGRVVAWMAHEYLGNIFGSVYDVSTILVLWFAGASAMAGLLHLVPRYLPRVGLAPEWVAYARPLVLVLFIVNVAVTLIFRANVEAQGGAYATGVLVLMFSASTAAALSLWKEGNHRWSLYCWGVVVVFGYTTVANIIERTDGIIIAGIFIGLILLLSGVSRFWRAKELRVGGHSFANEDSGKLWEQMLAAKVNLVPVPNLDAGFRRERTAKLMRNYCVAGEIAFVHVTLLDNRSEFLSPLTITVRHEDGQYLVEAAQAVAIANAVAYLSELLQPRAIYLGLSRQNMMRQSLRYFLLGEGETGLMVYTVLQHHWETTPYDDLRPCIYLMSE